MGDAEFGVPRIACHSRWPVVKVADSSRPDCLLPGLREELSVVEDESGSIDPFVWSVIREKARRLVGRTGLTKHDGDDLKQELILRLLMRMPAFDPDRGHRYVFVTTVVESSAANILRDRRAQKRDPHRIGSLNVPVAGNGEGPTELAATIGQREYDARRGRHPRSDEELFELASDVNAMVATLPSDLRGLADLLKHGSLSAVARELGRPYSTLQGEVEKIRACFEKASLREYL